MLEKPLQQLYIAEASPSKASWCDWVNDGIHIWIHTVVVNFMVVLNSGELIMANDG